MASSANRATTYLRIKPQGEQNWTNVPAPNEMQISYADLDAATTTRTSTGKMVRQVVRNNANNVRTIEFKWVDIPASVANTILGLVKKTYFKIDYYDLQTNAQRDTAEFYAGDRKATIKRLDNGVPFVKELSFTCIER